MFSSAVITLAACRAGQGDAEAAAPGARIRFEIHKYQRMVSIVLEEDEDYDALNQAGFETPEVPRQVIAALHNTTRR